MDRTMGKFKCFLILNINEPLNTANAFDDDRLERQATGQVMPDAFTHGISVHGPICLKKKMKWDGNRENRFTDSSLG